MRKLKAICATTILSLAFTVPVYAGDIGSPGAANPGDIGSPGLPSTSEDIMLILLGAISLF